MTQQTSQKINEFAESSIRALKESRELSLDIGNISTVARENARFIQTLDDINNQLTLLRNDLNAVREDVATVRTEMNSHFYVSEHKALIRISNASCARNNSQINWILVMFFICFLKMITQHIFCLFLKIPNRNLPEHNINNLGQFNRMSNVIALSYLEYYNLAPRNTVKENRKQFAQFLGITGIL